MSDQHLAFIFPAFASEYTNHPGIKLPGFIDHFHTLISIASPEAETRLADFDFENHNFLEDELYTQFITYIYSCAASVSLRKNGFIPSCSAGYSMGIYAALYDAGVISFTDGLMLIRSAYHAILKLTAGKCYNMGTVIGLDIKDIKRIVSASGATLEITNQNSAYAFVISGENTEVLTALDAAREEGALHVRQLNVNTPYHSVFLQPAAMEFDHAVRSLTFSEPSCPILSLIDGQELTSPESIRNELTNNLFHHLNWFHTLMKLLDNGINTFIECGPSRGLLKNAKFVEGKFKFYALDALPH